MRVYLFILCVFALLPLGLSPQSYAQATSHEHHIETQASTHDHHDEAHAPTHHCPMHPEVTGSEGDRCRKCGMFLTPIEDAKNEHERQEQHEHETQDMNSAPAPQNEEQASDIYICPMHPHIEGGKGDSCPICGMILAPKNDDKSSKSSGKHESYEDDGAFMISPTYKQALGVQTASATHSNLARDIRGYGRVAPSTRGEYAIDVRTEGWVTKLAVNAIGDEVKKGDLLFTYYSPDLMNAQADFLIGSRLGNAAQRLRLYGMDEQTISELKKRKKFFEETPFYAPKGGKVSALNAAEGAFIKQGSNIMTLQDYTELWVIADIPLKDAQFLKQGTKATITLPETAQKYESSVDYIYPQSDAQTRTAKVRLILDNPDGDIKTDSYVDINFFANPKMRLTVPSEAVLYSKHGAYVYEDLGDGYFRPVMVETGITSHDMTEIKSGLTHGQKIVTSGQFMLDAESNLKGGMAQMGHDHTAQNDAASHNNQ